MSFWTDLQPVSSHYETVRRFFFFICCTLLQSNTHLCVFFLSELYNFFRFSFMGIVSMLVKFFVPCCFPGEHGDRHVLFYSFIRICNAGMYMDLCIVLRTVGKMAALSCW